MRTKLDIYVSVMCSWAPNFMNYANDGCSMSDTMTYD
jgi:hypothetical protein